MELVTSFAYSFLLIFGGRAFVSFVVLPHHFKTGTYRIWIYLESQDNI